MDETRDSDSTKENESDFRPPISYIFGAVSAVLLTVLALMVIGSSVFFPLAACTSTLTINKHIESQKTAYGSTGGY
jgi:hypothetical protein